MPIYADASASFFPHFSLFFLMILQAFGMQAWVWNSILQFRTYVDLLPSGLSIGLICTPGLQVWKMPPYLRLLPSLMAFHRIVPLGIHKLHDGLSTWTHVPSPRQVQAELSLSLSPQCLYITSIHHPNHEVLCFKTNFIRRALSC